MNNILGISFTIWGVFCTAFAIIYVFVYPRPRKKYNRKFVKIVLRWFHCIVWVFLALSSFLRSVYALERLNVPLILAVTGLLVYIIFIFFFVNDQFLGQKKSVKIKK